MFFKPDLSNITTIQPRREFHHWCPKSQKFATVSNLVSTLMQGWLANSLVIRKTVFFGGTRRTSICYFELHQNNQYITMAVVDSPALAHLFQVNPFEVVRYQERKPLSVSKKREEEEVYVAV